MFRTDLFTKEFQAIGDCLYFNAAYMGPYPSRTQSAVKAMVDRFSIPANLDYSWVGFPEAVRMQLANLLVQNADQFSINASAGEVVSFYANGCNIKSGDRVALFKEEYPSDVLPWMFAQKTRGNFEIDFYENELLQDIDALKKALHPKTRFLNLSQVGFQNGNRVDLLNLGRYLQQREIRFIVDVTQGLGGVSISPAEIELIDVMLCSTYKWLLAPYGQAFAFWSKRALQETSQTHGNWLTQPAAPKDLTVYSLNAKEGARRFDRGQAPNILGLKGLEASLTLFQELGLSEIERHNLELANYFTENFDRKRYQLVTKSNLKSSIVCLKANNTDIDNLMQKLKSSNVDISVREGNLRISFHLYNSKIQVERLLKVL